MELIIGRYLDAADNEAMVSYACDRPLLAVTDATRDRRAEDVLEMVVLQLLASLPAHASQVWLYEPRASHCFAELKRLQAATHGEIGRQWFSAKDAVRALLGFDEMLLSRGSLLASADCPDLAAYNATRRVPEPTIIVLIVHPAALVGADVQILHVLTHLALRGPTCGIIPVLLHDMGFARSLGMSAQQAKAVYAVLAEIAGVALGFDFTGGAAAYGIGEPYQRFLADLGYAAEFPGEARKHQMERILANRQQFAARNHHQDFLRLRIGEARAKPAWFSLGHASHVFHALVSGGSGSGKTTFVQNLLLSLFETYPPGEVEVILLDYGSVSFGPYRKLAHVIGVFDQPADGAGLGRVFDYLAHELHRRKEAFKACGQAHDVTVDNMQTYRRLTSEALPILMLMIDEFGSLMSDENRATAVVDGREVPLRAHAERTINLLTREGRKVGMHVVLITQSFAKIDRMPQDFKSNPYVAVALKAEEPRDSRAILSSENDAAYQLAPFQAVLNSRAGQPAGNIIVDLDYVPEDEIVRRQRVVAARWPKQGPSLLETFLRNALQAPPGGSKEASDSRKAPGWLR